MRQVRGVLRSALRALSSSDITPCSSSPMIPSSSPIVCAMMRGTVSASRTAGTSCDATIAYWSRPKSAETTIEMEDVNKSIVIPRLVASEAASPLTKLKGEK